MQEDISDLPEQVQAAIRVVAIAAENLREVMAVHDYRTSEVPIYAALDDIAVDLKHGNHD